MLNHLTRNIVPPLLLALLLAMAACGGEKDQPPASEAASGGETAISAGGDPATPGVGEPEADSTGEGMEPRPALEQLTAEVEAAEGGAKSEAVRQLWIRAADLGAPDEALVEASDDDDAGNRLQAVRALWLAAADGHNSEGHVMEALQEALADPDPAVAAAARMALDDLAQLEAKWGR